MEGVVARGMGVGREREEGVRKREKGEGKQKALL